MSFWRSCCFTALCCSMILLCCKPPSSQKEKEMEMEESPPSRAALRAPGGALAHIEERTPAHTVHAFARCFPEDTATSPPRTLDALLDRGYELFDQANRLFDDSPEAGPGRIPPHIQALYESSLLCAEEAARNEPRSVEAHRSRSLVLIELGRLEQARDVYARALALDPDDVKTLADAADLYVNRLPPSLDHTETGLEYARRGSRRAKRLKDKHLIGRLALLEGQALNDLGHAREALSRLDAALAASDDTQARYERAVALFDLCRFPEARRGFEEVLARTPRDAWARHHLGLVLEAMGRIPEAEREFELARKEAPKDFPPLLKVSQEEFHALVMKEARNLPQHVRADLAHVSLETAELPDVADLTAEEPPLSPTILGLFRGAPLGEHPLEGPRTIILYRKNLLRVASSVEELGRQVRTTLLHELGHLRGEDDEALRARGLE